MRFSIRILFSLTLLVSLAQGQPQYDSCKANFLSLPVEKRLTGPLFWQHGESDAVLRAFVDRMYDAGNGNFTIESRPHPDWLGAGWYDDCKVILDYAKTRGMGAYIFDERWWPSFDVAGRVPAEHRARALKCTPYPPDVNQALSGTASASSVYSASYDASKANDNDLATRWNSAIGQNNDQWLEIAWSAARTFNSVVAKEEYGRITSYRIQHWNIIAVNRDSLYM